MRGRFTRGGPFDLPGGHYGWVVEIDPYDPGSTPVKHTALGRFRHENVGLRVEAGKPVAAYMGDDRVGGHVWKFVSDELYRPGDPASNRRLLSSGRLYAARFRPGGRGEWRLLDVSSPLDPNPAPRDPKPAIPRGARRLGDVYFSPGRRAHGRVPGGQRARGHAVGPARGRWRSIPATAACSSPSPPGWAGVGCGGTPSARSGASRRTAATRAARASAGSGSRWAGPPTPRARAGPSRSRTTCCSIAGATSGWPPTSRPRRSTRRRYGVFKNDGLFHLAVDGDQRGRPRQFASLPCEAEATGPAFAPGGAGAVPLRAAPRRAPRHPPGRGPVAPRKQLAAPPARRPAPARGRRHPTVMIGGAGVTSRAA